MRFNTALTSIGAAVVLMASPFMSANAAYSQIVAFGDSLSDNGNVFAATKSNLGVGIPTAPYWNGRFSNGPVAVEVMAQTLGLKLVDYAFGGALTGTTNRAGIPGLPGIQNEVNQFTSSLSAAGKTADASALYFLWGGGNDFLGADDKLAVVQPAIANLTGQVSQLYSAGARDFFVPLLPDLSNTLEAINGGTTAQAQAHALSVLFNTNLTSALQGLQGSLAGATIRVFDPNPALNAARDLVLAEGGTSTAACWTGNYTGSDGTLCANPDLYTLWDGVHPTARMHLAMGQSMAAAVPEPATAGLALVGLLIAGSAARRRAKAI
ncbi:SGNH/GDSL hydrolase family protein [Aquabacterium sp. CECT 9606]|uniref:SGNH/GDSL hydrolase family protein n=1 Tax=Aquabacterium sp. CECT 9606 TaxID=2845822 RepID=UPI001E2A1CA9|nr:SGNH/GDSL hydrolase family protein [Aquabacterium sp. CECT 9606]CAH0348773.1 Thermolabile hemolysin [Aquabacterium sp. CECT 9606]